MSFPSRTALRLRPALSQLSRAHSRASPVRFVGTKNPNPPSPIEPSDAQSQPLGAYYEAILNVPQPIEDVKPEEPPDSSIPKQKQKDKAAEKDDGAPSPPPTAKKPGTKTKPGRKPKNSPTDATASASSLSTPTSTRVVTAAERASIVFGSRLAGPAERAERLAELKARSRLVAGVLVPPKPDEPDNCCMSGCVNCVWDRYREEIETWSAAEAEAQTRLRSQHGEEQAAAMSMDEDGGGSERHWDVGPQKITKDLWDEELYKGVPVGIREFMRQEKKLKERHEKEGTSGG